MSIFVAHQSTHYLTYVDFLLLYLKLIQNDLNKTKYIAENIRYIKVPFLSIYLQKKIVSDIESNIISDECIEKLIKYNN